MTSPRPLFRDVTGDVFGPLASFQNQLRRGVPYWRARLDSASGIDVYKRQDEDIFATPAILDERIYVRTHDALYCFAKRRDHQ